MDDTPIATRKKGRHLRVPVLPEEEALIKQAAADAGMSIAAYLRAIALGYPVRSVVDSRQVETLLGISGELERLETLLTLWLANDRRTAQIGENVIRTALARITANQERMAETIHAIVRPRAARSSGQDEP